VSLSHLLSLSLSLPLMLFIFILLIYYPLNWLGAMPHEAEVTSLNLPFPLPLGITYQFFFV
jgi:uncharacterized membrane protein (DUF485 family)